MVNKNTKDEEIGFHKGALSTLAKERQEFQRLLQIVESLMQMHVNGLKDQGVDLSKETEKPSKKQKKPIEDLL